MAKRRFWRWSQSGWVRFERIVFIIAGILFIAVAGIIIWSWWTGNNILVIG